MANISTIKFLDELIIKAINAIPKSQKRPTKPISMIPLKYSMKTVTLMIDYFGKEGSTLRRTNLYIINRQKMEIRLTFRTEIEKLLLLQLIKKL